MGAKGRPMKTRLKRDICRLIQPETSVVFSDQLVDRLLATFPHYGRLNLPFLTARVKEAVDANNKEAETKNEPKSIGDEVVDDPSSLPPAKKTRRANNIDGSEQSSFLRPSACSSTAYGSGDDDGDGAKSAVSSSGNEDFDLTKSLLRDKYSGPKIDEKRNEEVVDKKVDSIRGEDRGIKLLLKGRKTVENYGPDEVKKGKNDWPMFEDLGGMDGELHWLSKVVLEPLRHPEMFDWVGARPPVTEILLHGPPGCGKTTLARAIANEIGIPFYNISSPELVSGISGASEENIRELFSKAYRTAPSIVFIDEIDAIAPKRDNLNKPMENRIVTQLMTCMDDRSQRVVKPSETETHPESSDGKPVYVLVIGATNRPDAIDEALRRRFRREIGLDVPDAHARLQILLALTRHTKLEAGCDLAKIVWSTPGFVGADIENLVNTAANLAVMRILDGEPDEARRRRTWSPEEMNGKLAITMADLEEAVKSVQPSSKREGFSDIPNVKWEDVGGLDMLRNEFERCIVNPIRHPEEYEQCDLETGILLYGPPGCGKTLIAKAVANEAGANFIHVKGPELLNKYVGESELAVRTIFKRARRCCPCIIFFDEVDALTTQRGKEGGWVVERLLNQLLTELDGGDLRKGVYVIGATNRPDVMDGALLRPGRFGELLYVPLPNPDERVLILKALARKKAVDADVDLNAIGRSEACANFSGADLSALMNKAAMAAIEEKLRMKKAAIAAPTESPVSLPQSSSSGIPRNPIKTTHLQQELAKIVPSVSETQRRYYRLLAETLKAC